MRWSREAGNAVAATDAAMPSLQSPACAATGFSEALASSSCNDELPDQPDSHGSFTLTDPGPLETQKNANFSERRKASSGSSGGTV